jgi:predicted phage baseplate assembly protein
LRDVAVARGNVLLVDHGRHVEEEPWEVPGTVTHGCCVCENAVQDIVRVPGTTGHRLSATPLTWAEPLPADAPVCRLLARNPRRALPGLVLDDGAPWEARGDLLASASDDRHFVVEIDDEGLANLRFGDGTHGRQPQAGAVFRAAPRAGNGPVGNVGSDSIIWLAFKANPVSGADLQPRNPLPASGGAAPESVAEVKLFAPGAFRATPMRAIVADDYAMFAARAPELQGAACAMEWTGSWYEANVVVDPLGSARLADGVDARITGELERVRRIGHDVAVEAARYVPLLVEVFVCVRPDFVAAHVEAELRDRFASGARRDGTPGFFHPDRLRLGAPVHASELVAQAQSITGVAHVEVRTLARMENARPGDIPADGVLAMGAREIAQLANDPDHPDRGRIVFAMGGGR